MSPPSLRLTITLKLYFAGVRKAIDHEVLKNYLGEDKEGIPSCIAYSNSENDKVI